jgi:hypothetical protein
MTKNQIIAELFTGKNFNSCIAKMEPEYLRDDLRMEVIAIVCEWPDDKIIGLYERKELDYYVVRVILNQIQSDSSPFYKKYRRALIAYEEHSMEQLYHVLYEGNSIPDLRQKDTRSASVPSFLEEQEEMEQRRAAEEMEEDALREVGELYWYNAELLKLYAVHGNYRALERVTGIPYVSCYHSIRKSVKEIQQKVL